MTIHDESCPAGEPQHVLPLTDPVEIASRLVRYRFAMSFIEEGHVLDAGCGDRDGPLLLAGKGVRVIGVDVNVEAVRVARERFQGAAVSYGAVDCRALPFRSALFDTVISLEVIEHLPEEDHPRYLAEMERVLRPGGHYIGSTPNRAMNEPGRVNEAHLKEYTLCEYRHILAVHFNETVIYGEHASPGFRMRARMCDATTQGVMRWDGLGLRRIVPRTLRDGVKRLLSRQVFKVTEESLDAGDCSITREELERAVNFVAVCRKGRG